MPSYAQVVEELLLQRGEKKGHYFVGDLTTKEILERLEMPIGQVNHNSVVQTIKSFYPKSSFEEFSEDSGYVIHVRIRTK